MVMADKNQLLSRPGKRKIVDSPDSEHGDSFEPTVDQEKGFIRVGKDFQAEIPAFNPNQKCESPSKAMLVWAPALELSDARVDQYVTVAKEKHGYNTEQALGMLFWHKHNVDRALSDLSNFTPFPEEWSVEDKVLFEQAYNFHGKQFSRIRQMLPDKSVPSLVKFFYSWKKTKARTSLLDRQAKKEMGSRPGDRKYEDMDSDDSGSHHSGEVLTIKEEEEACKNCRLQTTQLHVTSEGSLCSVCYQHWRRTGEMRVAGSKRHESLQGRHGGVKHKRHPPKGMYLDSSDLATFVTAPHAHTQAKIQGLETEIANLKHQVQSNKQTLSQQKQTLGSGVEEFRPGQLPHKITSRWTNEELLLAVQGVRKYGRDFEAIAEMIGNKQEVHVRSFFLNFGRRYNLDEVLAEYEAEHGAMVIADNEETTPDPHAATSLVSAEVKDNMQVDGADGRGVPHVNGTAGNVSTPRHHPPPLLPQTSPLVPGPTPNLPPSTSSSRWVSF